MDHDQASPPIPTDVLPQHFMFRPRSKVIWVQMLVFLGILGCVGAVLYLLGGTMRTLIYGLAAMLVGAAVVHAIWYLRIAPRVVVVCESFLGITDHSGNQQRIPWSSIALAKHSVKYLGMQWELDLIPAGRVVLRDVGIAPDRWGILRAIIIHCAGAGGAAVFVDNISESVYPGQ